MAESTIIAEAVVAELRDFFLLTVTRAYAPRYEQTELKELRTTVVVMSQVDEYIARETIATTSVIDVALQQVVDPSDIEQMDELIDKLDSIKRHFLGFQVAQAFATCLKAELVPGAEAGYVFKHLDELQIFTGICRLTFER